MAVSAGSAPLSIGTETDGLLICPAEGIVPVSQNFDSPGPMTKTSYDLAILLDVITGTNSSNSFTSNLKRSWKDISVATLDPAVWKFPDSFVKPVPEATAQTMKDISAAYKIIESRVKRFISNVPLVTNDSFQLDGENSEVTITRADMKKELNAYLEGLKESKVWSLQDIIDFNEMHADQELPSHHGNQDFFLATQKQNLPDEDYDRNLKHLRQVCGELGIDKTLREYNVDVIISPADSFINSIAAGSGLAALAGKGQDAVLVEVLSAWEATFAPRKPPPMLLEES